MLNGHRLCASWADTPGWVTQAASLQKSAKGEGEIQGLAGKQSRTASLPPQHIVPLFIWSLSTSGNCICRLWMNITYVQLVVCLVEAGLRQMFHSQQHFFIFYFMSVVFWDSVSLSSAKHPQFFLNEQRGCHLWLFRCYEVKCCPFYCLLKCVQHELDLQTLYNRLFVVATDCSPLVSGKLLPENIPLLLISIPMFTLLVLTNHSNQQHSAATLSDIYWLKQTKDHNGLL